MLPIRRVILHVLPLLIIACAAHAAAPTGQKQGIHFDQVTYTNSGLTARVNLPAGTTEVGESGLYTFLAVAQDSEVQMNLNGSGDGDAWQVNAGNAMTWRGLHLVPLSISRSGELPIPPVAEELNIEIKVLLRFIKGKFQTSCKFTGYFYCSTHG